ncbi:hypothetical protein KFE25_006079 [Diacronema lutheri]|uniref:BLOC-1-related complex subunit 7 n=1 Tax=Diacronema lutheri TaxID=2081491 RepID=A0A8J5Y1E9_DIALT|nr:hypothetical protein KFE25_006079 [Diacronema lutheri]
MAADAIKKELAERAQHAIVAAGAVTRGDVRAGGNDEFMLAARAFANHERNMCATEAVLAELGDALTESDHELAAIARAATRIPIARAGLLATLDMARCDSRAASSSKPSANVASIAPATAPMSTTASRSSVTSAAVAGAYAAPSAACAVSPSV